MIRRVLMATINSDHPQRGMEQAFRAVFNPGNVATYDYLARRRAGVHDAKINSEITDAARAFKPDWIWLQLQTTGVISWATLQAIRRELPGTVLSHWMGDMRRGVPSYLSEISRICHLTLCSSEGQVPEFEKAGARRVAYCQIGVDWEEDVMGLPSWAPQFRVPAVVFCGTHYGTAFPGTVDREAMARALMAAKVDFGIVGKGWKATGLPVIGECRVKEQHHVYQRAQIAINVNNFNDVARYYSDRLLIAMASGRPVVSRYVPELEKDFENGRHLLWYTKPEELVDAVRRLLADAELRNRIGRQGRAEILRAHTWWNRIMNVLPLVEEIAADERQR